MSALEEITAAIDRLTALRAASTPGDWWAGPGGRIRAGEYNDVIDTGPVDCMAYCYGGTSTIEGDNLGSDLDLIVTLHATIDPLLTLLGRAALRARSYAEQGLVDLLVQGMLSGELTLARAINQNGEGQC